MPVTYLMSRHARIDVTLDGVTFTRTESDAAGRGAGRSHVDWEDVTGAEVQTTGSGRAVIRIAVADESAAPHHRSDPYAIKVSRRQSRAVRQLVQQIEAEAAGRRRWRQHAQS